MKIPYYNSEDRLVVIGGVMVPPGETRLVDECLVPATDSEPDNGGAGQQGSEPGNGGTGQQGSEPDNGGAVVVDREKLAELLTRKQDDVLKELPGLSLQEIEVLGGLEQEGQARKGILGAVAERLLESAARTEQ